MDMQPQPYLVGSGTSCNLPLQRHLPLLPAGSVPSWLREHYPPGTWLLDPFGFNPWLSLEAAKAGYRVLVACNHPLLAFMLKILAAAPEAGSFRSALAALANARRGNERLEQYVQGLYQTECPTCGASIQAQGFLWQRNAAQPYARLIHCPHCGTHGEHALAQADHERLNLIGSDALHRARALTRVVGEAQDARRDAVENALRFYLSRPLTVLFTLINRSEGLGLPPERQRLLTALLLSLCDDANVLWPWPNVQTRPRQLQIPATFLEHNMWLALEQAIESWTVNAAAVPLSDWPQLPPEDGGICLFNGRVRALMAQARRPQPQAILGVIGRPSPAFWILSTLWSGWLFGIEATSSLQPLLTRRFFDWHWQASALEAALRPAVQNASAGFTLWLHGSEVTPATLLALLLAPYAAGFDLKGFALQPDEPALQTTWQPGSSLTTANHENPKVYFQQAVRRHLEALGEPADYLVLYAAALLNLMRAGLLPRRLSEIQANYSARLQAILDEVLADTSFVTRLHSRAPGDDGARWWLVDQPLPAAPLADAVEKTVVSTLLRRNGLAESEILQTVYRTFPGLLTPRRALIHAILESYGESHPETGQWTLRSQDQPASRHADLDSVKTALQSLGEQLGYRVLGDNPLLWQRKPDEAIEYAFYRLASAMISRFLTQPQANVRHHVLVLPGGRAGLLAYKIQRDSRLASALQHGWHVLKFRHLRHLASQSDLTHEVWTALLDSDPPLWRETAQMSMF